MAIENVTELDSWLAQRNLAGHWNGMGRGPEFKPFLWKWSDIYEGLMTATKVVAMEDTGRRTIQCRNPSLGDRMSNTIHMSVQCVMPGEIATAHNHTAAAIRFVVQGQKDAATVVNGEPFPMETGDLVTTPAASWHDHYNHGEGPIIWLDVLDIRLANIGKILGGPFPGGDTQPIQRPAGYTGKTLGYAKPSWLKDDNKQPPPFRYPWAETYDTLQALKESETEGDPFDGLQLTYTNPVNGGPTLPTFACELQLFTPNMRTQEHRHISTTIYQVFEGEGTTIIDGERFEWTKGDIFVVPPWAWHRHENRSGQDSILFSVSDEPTLTAIGLYEEEAKS